MRFGSTVIRSQFATVIRLQLATGEVPQLNAVAEALTSTDEIGLAGILYSLPSAPMRLVPAVIRLQLALLSSPTKGADTAQILASSRSESFGHSLKASSTERRLSAWVRFKPCFELAVSAYLSAH